MTVPAEPEVRVERADRVLVMTINRPAQKNAMTRAAGEIVAAALDELDTDSSLSVGILTGAGGTFCAGMDLKRFAAGELASVPGRGFGGLTERPPVKPLIAAVEGHAVAGGFELVLACDLVVAARGARFGLPEVKRGLVARGGGLFRLPRSVPKALAAELIFTGDVLTAERAAALGLVNRLVDDTRALPEALALARQVAAGAPLALAASKRILAESADWPEAEAFARQASITDPVFASEDAREGALAFAEKRPPVWRGR
ncbi:crotonase/enoyl-CoA hydratase family protein [Frankia sp. AgB1.9]|uniref:crotonase/enoyl-CoA hydratase family protein n=1 Tax=unclassified Frankia TaxID=2632575 RepID=UPI001933A241|nr:MULTISPECIES: crotonase/enoyl-CoA hydratase family protein [unclassified Frankia]MBL7488178.1 crotonase/enoyl-CoA hydratase family protein [Frankia sp. AgW1.1]MBL7553232.1 crotonase/enoyl-CoA hydratase family protein [Frankia sp. AgB1.9]MBL7620181.1 crotonase/enoyl-CoA hydratase family protein [Frankia sp. AgB1.8]